MKPSSGNLPAVQEEEDAPLPTRCYREYPLCDAVRWFCSLQYIAHCHVVDAISRHFLEALFEDRHDGDCSTTVAVDPSTDAKEACRSLYREFLREVQSKKARNGGQGGGGGGLQCGAVETAVFLSQFVRRCLTLQQRGEEDTVPHQREEEEGEAAAPSKLFLDESHFVSGFRRFNISQRFPWHTKRFDSVTPPPPPPPPCTPAVDAPSANNVESSPAPSTADRSSQKVRGGEKQRVIAVQQKKLQEGVSVKKRYEMDALAPFIRHTMEKAADAYNAAAAARAAHDNDVDAMGEEEEEEQQQRLRRRRHRAVLAWQDIVVVDVGAGQGYLSARLAVDYGLRVIALERESQQLHGSLKRSQVTHVLQEARRMHQSQSSGSGGSSVSSSSPSGVVAEGQLHIVNMDVNERTDISRLEEEIRTCIKMPKDEELVVALVSLHACGSLSHNMLRLFVDWQHQQQRGSSSSSSSSCVACINVGCCYNLINPEPSPDAFPMSSTVRRELEKFHVEFEGRPDVAANATPQLLSIGRAVVTRNMFMTASQTPHRWWCSGGDDDDDNGCNHKGGSRQTKAIRELCDSFSSLYQRALLQKVLKEFVGLDDLNIIGRAPSKRVRTDEEAASTTTTTPLPPPTRDVACGVDVDTDYEEEREFVHYAMAVIARLHAKLDGKTSSGAAAGDGQGVPLRSITAEQVTEAYRTSRAQGQREQFAILWTIKVLLGHCLEALIIADRCWFLEEKLGCQVAKAGGFQVGPVALFDVRESPRNQAIVALWD